MHEINIFIASSFEMIEWREAIGNAIRQWSDIYEPSGYRIRMLCWEDFHPEYTGIRKQTEYNEDLVKKSHLFFALFKSKCGDYTKEEVNVAYGLPALAQNSHILVDKTGIQSAELKTFLANPPFSRNDCGDIENAIGFIYTKLLSYFASLPYKVNEAKPLVSYNVYSTLGSDLKHKTNTFGNLIRSIDATAEKYIRFRCRLLDNNIKKIDKSDYYIALLKDQVSIDEQAEILKALELTGPDSHPQNSILYYNHDDKFLQNHPDLKTNLDKIEDFNAPYDSDHRIKFNLLVWLISKKVMVINDNAGLVISNGWVRYHDVPLISTDDLNLKGDSEEDLLIDLLRIISSKLLTNGQGSMSDSDKTLDLPSIQDRINRIHKAENAINDVRDKIVAEKLSVLRQIDILLQKPEYENIAKNTVELYLKKEELQHELLASGNYDVRELLKTKINIIGLFDTYGPKLFKNNYDENRQYQSICELADKYSILDPTVEAMRMNFANAYNRANRNAKALQLYNTSLTNLKGMYDGSMLMMSYITPVYIHIIHHYTELGLSDEAVRNLKDYEALLYDFQERYPANLFNKVCELMILSAWFTLFDHADDLLDKINRAFTIWYRLIEEKPFIPEDYWDDIYCYFPTTIATAVMDASWKYHNLSKKFDDAERVLNQAIEILSNNIRIDPELKYFHLGQLYHNLCTLYSVHRGIQPTARRYGLESLEYKQKLYQIQPTPENYARIADILFLLGATYINTNHKKIFHLRKEDGEVALEYANKSYEIFKSFDTEGYLGPRTKVYEVLLLKGTILFFTPGKKEEGFAIVQECYDWSLQNPDNEYRYTFETQYRRMKSYL